MAFNHYLYSNDNKFIDTVVLGEGDFQEVKVDLNGDKKIDKWLINVPMGEIEYGFKNGFIVNISIQIRKKFRTTLFKYRRNGKKFTLNKLSNFPVRTYFQEKEIFNNCPEDVTLSESIKPRKWRLFLDIVEKTDLDQSLKSIYQNSCGPLLKREDEREVFHKAMTDIFAINESGYVGQNMFTKCLFLKGGDIKDIVYPEYLKTVFKARSTNMKPCIECEELKSPSCGRARLEQGNKKGSCIILPKSESCKFETVTLEKQLFHEILHSIEGCSALQNEEVVEKIVDSCFSGKPFSQSCVDKEKNIDLGSPTLVTAAANDLNGMMPPANLRVLDSSNFVAGGDRLDQLNGSFRSIADTTASPGSANSEFANDRKLVAPALATLNRLSGIVTAPANANQAYTWSEKDGPRVQVVSQSWLRGGDRGSESHGSGLESNANIPPSPSSLGNLVAERVPASVGGATNPNMKFGGAAVGAGVEGQRPATQSQINIPGSASGDRGGQVQSLAQERAAEAVATMKKLSPAQKKNAESVLKNIMRQTNRADVITAILQSENGLKKLGICIVNPQMRSVSSVESGAGAEKSVYGYKDIDSASLKFFINQSGNLEIRP